MPDHQASEDWVKSNFTKGWSMSVNLDPLNPESGPVPFARNFPEGTTILDGVKTILDEEEAWEHMRFRLPDMPEDEIIEDWRDLKPKAGTEVIMVLMPGFNFKKFFTAIVAAVVIVTAAAFLAPMVAGLTGWAGLAEAGFTAAKAVFWGGLYDAARGDQKQDTVPDGAKAFISGGANRLAPWDPVPRPLGRRRFSPPLAANDYIEAAGEKTFYHMLVCWGMGDIEIDDLRFGNEPITQFLTDGRVTIEHFGPGQAKDSSQTRFPVIETDPINAELGTDWVLRTTRPGSDGIGLIFVMPQGLFRLDDRNRQAPISVEVIVEIRKKGDKTWRRISDKNLKQHGHTQNRRIFSIKIDDDTDESVWVPRECGIGPVRERYCTRWTGRDDDRCERWAWRTVQKYRCISGHYAPKGKAFREAAEYEVRVKRLPPNNFAGGAWADRIDWVNMASHLPGKAVLADGMTLSAIRVESSDQTTGNLQNLNAIVAPKIPVFDEASGQWVGAPAKWRGWNGGWLAGFSAQPPATTSADLNTVAKGVWRFTASAANRPSGSDQGVMAYFTDTTTKEAQIAVYRKKDGGNRAKFRTRTRANASAAWGSWGPWFTSNNPYLASSPGDVLENSKPRIVEMGKGDTPPSNLWGGRTGFNGRFMIIASGTRQGKPIQYAMLFDVNNRFTWYRTLASTAATGKPVTSENPADILRYAMTSPYVNPDPIPLDRIDNRSFADFWRHCNRNGESGDDVVKFVYGKILVGAPLAADVFEEIASAGLGTVLDDDDNMMTVSIDAEKPSPTNLVIPSSTEAVSEVQAADPPVQAMRVRYPNPDNDFSDDIMIVYNDGFNEANTKRYQDVALNFVPDKKAVYKLARHYLFESVHRRFVWTGVVGKEYATLRRGQRVLFAKSSFGIGQRAGFITGTDPTTRRINLSTPVTFESGKSYQIAVRRMDGQGVVTATATASVGTTKIVTVSNLTNIEPGAMFQFGERNRVAEDAIITRIEPVAEGRRRLTMIPYRQAIVNASTQIPDFQNVFTAPVTPNYQGPPPPVINSSEIRSDESALTATVGGSKLPAIKIPVGVATPGGAGGAVSANYTGAQNIRVRWKKVADADTEWEQQDWPADAGVITIQPVEARAEYDLRFRTLDSRLGQSSEVRVRHTAVGTGALPPDVQKLVVNRTDGGTFLTWTYPDPPLDLTHFEIRFANTKDFTKWERMRRLEGSFPANARTTGALSIGGTYAIKAVDAAGNYSLRAAFVNAPNLEGDFKVLENLNYHENSYPGTKEDVVASGNTLQLGSVTTPGGSLFMKDWPVLSNLGPLSSETTTRYGGSDLEGTYTAGVVDCGVGTFLVSIESEVNISNILALNQLWARYRATLLKDIGVLGTAVTAEDYVVDAEIRTATTRTPGAGEAVYNWGDWGALIAGEFECRYFQVRLILRTFDPEVTPQIDKFRVTARLKRRGESGTGTTPLSVTFDPAFYENPIMTPVANLADGERITTAVTRSTATIGVVNSSNVAQNKTVFWSATGFGKQVS